MHLLQQKFAALLLDLFEKALRRLSLELFNDIAIDLMVSIIDEISLEIAVQLLGLSLFGLFWAWLFWLCGHPYLQ